VLTLGDWRAEAMQGPAIWLKTMLGRRLEGANWSSTDLPILYLPGVGRADLRSAEDCPEHLLPLVELLFRGTVFSQPSGKDWTVPAFLHDKDKGVGLDVGTDGKTAEAIVRAAEVLAAVPVARLRHRRLEASDFDTLLVEDVPGQVLRWLDDAAACRDDLGAHGWQAFAAACKRDLGVDPDADGVLVAAERLASQAGGWLTVWRRFVAAATSYPRIPGLLDKVAPPAEPPWNDAFPSHDLAAETLLRSRFLALHDIQKHLAEGELRDLDGQYGYRRQLVWAALERAPLAKALRHLVALVDAVNEPVGGNSAEALLERYTAGGWRADLAVLQALASVRTDQDVEAVSVAIRAVYLPWLEDGAKRLQKHIAAAPDLAALHSGGILPVDGECVVFADGLRFDVANLLLEALQGTGCTVAMTTRWAGLPTVTATCKPAVSAFASVMEGTAKDMDFLPRVTASQKLLTSGEFRAQLSARGIQVLQPAETGQTDGKAWAEHGALDSMGHAQGWKLAWRIDEEVAGLAQRVRALLDAGWSRVRVVTDHGWLLVPGGLPKAELHASLAETRWGRCAVAKDGAKVPYPTAPWSWSATVPVTVAPGVATFTAGYDYAHGGWSLQEAVAPVLDVTRQGAAAKVTVAVKWRRLRCNVTVEGVPPGSRVDVRTQVAQPASSLTQGGKLLEAGQATLLVENDDLEGTPAFLVVLGPSGTVFRKDLTVVGGAA
jgi:hypothetical protein